MLPRPCTVLSVVAALLVLAVEATAAPAATTNKVTLVQGKTKVVLANGSSCAPNDEGTQILCADVGPNLVVPYVVLKPGTATIRLALQGTRKTTEVTVHYTPDNGRQQDITASEMGNGTWQFKVPARIADHGKLSVSARGTTETSNGTLGWDAGALGTVVRSIGEGLATARSAGRTVRFTAGSGCGPVPSGRRICIDSGIPKNLPRLTAPPGATVTVSVSMDYGLKPSKFQALYAPASGKTVKLKATKSRAGSWRVTLPAALPARGTLILTVRGKEQMWSRRSKAWDQSFMGTVVRADRR